MELTEYAVPGSNPILFLSLGAVENRTVNQKCIAAKKNMKSKLGGEIRIICIQHCTVTTKKPFCIMDEHIFYYK
jgi:hypothetical protein